MRNKNENTQRWREEFRDKERGWNRGNLIIKRARRTSIVPLSLNSCMYQLENLTA